MIDNDKGVTKRALILNHYGVMEAAGPELVETGIKQAEKFGATIVQGTVTKVDKGIKASKSSRRIKPMKRST